MEELSRYQNNLPYYERTRDKEGNFLNIVDYQKRKDREIRIGDIYCYRSNSSYHRIIRLTKKKEDYEQYYYDYYDINEMKWKPAIEQYSNGETYIPTVGADSLRDYYYLLLEPIEEMVERSKKMLAGEIDMLLSYDPIDENISSETALSTTKMSKDELYRIVDQTAIFKNRSEEYSKVMEIIINTKRMELEKIKDKIVNQVAILNGQIKKMMKVIQAIELYAGINEEVFQICSGEPANANVPISIRQMILFMDEEVAASDIYGHLEEGFDYKNKEDFYKWLMDKENRDRIIPELKGVVVVKPRRRTKYYSNNAYENAMINQWNKTSYIIIRNGDNLYSIYSENISIYERVFPKKAELQEIIKKLQEGSEYDKEIANSRFADLETRSRFFALLIQGLIDRSEIFYPLAPNTSILKGIGIEFVYDDENILADGRKSYKEWKQEINSTITRGSRIGLLCPSYYDYHKKDLTSRYYQYYADEYSAPDLPDTGIYTVESKEVDGFNGKRTDLFIRYFAGGEYYQYGRGYVQRKLKTSFRIDIQDEFILNYDRLNLEDIDYYINSRVDRQYYGDFLLLFKEIRKNLIREMELEQNFIDMLMWDYAGNGMPEEEIRKKIIEAIDWWKYKVIWKRPITKDDKKAYKMIISYLKNKYGLILQNNRKQ